MWAWSRRRPPISFHHRLRDGMATPTDIARAQILLGSTERWTDTVVGAAIDSEGGVVEGAILLLESAATAAAFDVDVKAGSQSITASHVAGALRAAAQRLRDQYGITGGVGTISTLLPSTGRGVLGNDFLGQDRSTLACVNGCGVIGYGDGCESCC